MGFVLRTSRLARMLGLVSDRKLRRHFTKAIGGSLLIYALPLVGPHAVWLLGEYLLADFTRAPGYKPLAWIALDVLVALTAEGALALLLAWVLTRRGVTRWALLVSAAPVFFVTLERAYLSLLPSYFLIEPDRARELSDWPTECFLPAVALATVRTAPDLPLERAARAWLTSSGGRSYALLEACSLDKAESSTGEC
jgi:hypothetical protein